MTTITTWNIRYGDGTRLQQITGVLDSYSSSDVLVITEYRPNKNGKVHNVVFDSYVCFDTLVSNSVRRVSIVAHRSSVVYDFI